MMHLGRVLMCLTLGLSCKKPAAEAPEAQPTVTLLSSHQGPPIPVTYDVLSVGFEAGQSFEAIQETVAAALVVPMESVHRTKDNEVMVDLRHADPSLRTSVSAEKLKKVRGLIFARPVAQSGHKYWSFGRMFHVKLKQSTSIEQLTVLAAQHDCALLKKHEYLTGVYVLDPGPKNDYDPVKMANVFFETKLFEETSPTGQVFRAPPPY